jgi:hypothetical protein
MYKTANPRLKKILTRNRLFQHVFLANDTDGAVIDFHAIKNGAENRLCGMAPRRSTLPRTSRLFG